MVQHSTGNRILLYFSHWSKKGYSIFVSLGREVKITRLSIHMYATILLKSFGRGGVIVNTAHVSEFVFSQLKKEAEEGMLNRFMGEVYPEVPGVFCK